MENYMIYILKVNAILSFLFLIYLALLKKEKFFRLNRVFLMGTLIISLLLPLAPQLRSTAALALQQQIPVMNTFSNFYSQSSINKPVREGGEIVSSNESEIQTSITFSPLKIVFIVYLVVGLTLFIRFAYQLLNLFFLIKKHLKFTERDGINYYEHDESMSPFSFFYNLFINRSQYTDEQIDQIIAHEKVHIRQWHTLDILFTEIMQALLWINPFVYIFKEHVKLNLEYLADECVLEQGINKKNYQLNILQSVLNPDMFSLTNMFNSSKLKLRIKMMNARKTPLKNLYKYGFVIPVIAIIYFAINPITASPVAAYYAGQTELKSFEGRYQFQKDKQFFLQVTAKENTLVLNQLWDGKEIIFERKSELEFSGNHDNFPLAFKKNKEGTITQLVAFKQDLWDKVDRLPEAKEIQLNESQLNKLEGYYQFQNNKAAYIQFTVRDRQLVAHQMWDNAEHLLAAYSETKFKSREKGIPVEFIEDANGNVIQALVLVHERLDKVNEYKPVDRKIAQLTAAELKAVEGYYQFEKKKDFVVQVYAKGNGIVLRQLWDKEERLFDPESPLIFSAIVPASKIAFNKDTNGNITQMTSVSGEVLLKMSDYKPATK